MCLVRRMVLVSMKFNIHFRAKHVRGRDNRLADSLSRLRVQTFHRMAPWADPTPTILPKPILPQKFDASLNTLVRRAMTQSTWNTYQIAVKHFIQFLQPAGMPCSLPVPSLQSYSILC